MHINGHPTITLRHLCIGGHLSCLMFPHNQLKCPACGATKTQSIPFKALGYRITEELYQYTRDLLAFGTYTNLFSRNYDYLMTAKLARSQYPQD